MVRGKRDVALRKAPSAPATPRSSKGFLRRLTAATGGGMFLDGWIFAAIAAVIAGKTFAHDLSLSSLELGVVSASTLVGTLIGSPIIGYLTDIIGRKPMFIVDVCTFIVGALLMFVVSTLWQVAALKRCPPPSN